VASDTETVAITVTDANRAPILAAIGPKTVAENTPLTFTVAATDADGNTLTYAASGLPTGATFDPATKAFSWTPTYAQAGPHSVTFTVTDNGSPVASDSETVAIAVTDANRPPVLAAIGPKTVAENTLLTFTVAATDADGNTLTYAASGLPTGATFDPATKTFSWTPTFAQAGPHSVTFTVTDNGSPVASDSETVAITVTDANRAPAAVNDTYTATEETTLNIAVAGVLANDTDPDGNALTAALITAPSHGTLTLNANGSFTYTPALNYEGPDNFTYRANDGKADSSAATVTISVVGENDRPTISNVADQTTPSGTSLGPLGVTIGDVETAAASLVLSAASSNSALVPLSGIVLGGTGTARTVTITPAAGQSGSATITLTVSDGSATAADSFVMTVTQVVKTATTTSAPTSSLNPSTFGQAVTFSATVTGAGATPTGTVQFTENDAPLGAPVPLNASGVATLNTTALTGGTRTIKAVYSGDSRFAASTSAGLTQTVNKLTGTGTFLTLTPIQKQYSDRVLMEATVSPANAADTVTFQIGTQVLATVPVVNGKATANPQLLGNALTGSKIVTAVFNSQNYTTASKTKSMSILKEDARVAYSQPTTLCLCGKASVPITVNVSDITAIDPTIDPDAGNIGTATVTFNNRTTLATYGTVTVTPNADGKTGTATYNLPASALGTAASATITFGFIVSGSYNRNNTADNAAVTITR
jgi:VCBS repeat-containing protein